MHTIETIRWPVVVLLGIVVVAGLVSFAGWHPSGTANFLFSRTARGRGVPPARVPSPYSYVFNGRDTLEEQDVMDDSRSPYWWLNSGGELLEGNGIGSTLKGELPKRNKWRLEYADSNSEDTDGGYHPQNVFRLVSRQPWLNYRQEIYFRIIRDHLSASQNRNESNGVLLFNRYLDGDNLYYAGVRVDGTVVIKKKLAGVYFTLARAPVWSSPETYDRASRPNLLPKNNWVGLASEVRNLSDGSVSIELYVDAAGNGSWKKTLEVKDDGLHYGQAMRGAGYTGIRTDFMDVEFKQYLVRSL